MNTGFYILTRGPGTGKSTVLDLLSGMGVTCIEESARQVIRERVALGLSPRPNPGEFTSAILDKDVEKYRNVDGQHDIVIVDRGIPDALCLLYDAGCIDLKQAKDCLVRHPCKSVVFAFNPWREIYVPDAERDHSFAGCTVIAARISDWYERMGFRLLPVPTCERVDFILNQINTPL